ncbi:hypothetical protein, partial [Arthrobacter sp. H5]|uniref:hypothetical protein n=1 Tax=Arthrobacter sp. H5 TaxID=1267973 RepID=UPI000686A8A9
MSTQNWPQDPTEPADPVQSYPETPIYQDTQSTNTQTNSTTSTAKDQAKEVGHEGVDAAKNVAHTAGSEAKNVAHEAGAQAKNLLNELGSDLKSQAGAQQQKVSEGLRSISDELSSMAAKSEEDGTATQLVQQAAQRTGAAAGWLDGRDPGSLLDEVKGFARERPGTFLLVAAGAGLLAGRLTRGLTGAKSDESEQGNTESAPPRTADSGYGRVSDPQAGAQQQKVSEGLRSISDELSSMAAKSEEDGTATQLVQQAAQRTGAAAGWLDGRDPGSLLDEVKGFARERPGTFLLVAAGAGLLAGRLTRGLTGAKSDESEQGNTE